MKWPVTGGGWNRSLALDVLLPHGSVDGVCVGVPALSKTYPGGIRCEGKVSLLIISNKVCNSSCLLSNYWDFWNNTWILKIICWMLYTTTHWVVDSLNGENSVMNLIYGYRQFCGSVHLHPHNSCCLRNWILDTNKQELWLWSMIL